MNGEDELEPAETVGTKPPPEGVDVEEGFKSPKPEDGTEGGLGIDGAAEVGLDSALDSCPGLQLDFVAISSRCFVICSDNDTKASDKSANGSSLMALVKAVTSDELSPRIDVQYEISASEASDLVFPLVSFVVEVVGAEIEVEADCVSSGFEAGVGVDEDPKENDAVGLLVEAAGAGLV